MDRRSNGSSDDSSGRRHPQELPDNLPRLGRYDEAPFFNWSIGRGLAASNPVRRVKLFHEDNSRLRYLSQDEYDRLLSAARSLSTRTSVSTPSPYLVEKIILAAHTGLRRGSLFNLRWDQIDLEHRVVRIPRTKNGRSLSLPLNVTAHDTLTALHEARTRSARTSFRIALVRMPARR
jgi:integrase